MKTIKNAIITLAILATTALAATTSAAYDVTTENPLEIRRITLSRSGNWVDIAIESQYRGIVHCTAFDHYGIQVNSVNWLVEYRHTTVNLKVDGVEVANVECQLTRNQR